jgi:perosamine synthetase
MSSVTSSAAAEPGPGIARHKIPFFTMTTDSRRISTYQSAIKAQFRFLKEVTSLETWQATSIALPSSGGLLLPICRLHADDEVLIRDLAAWRQASAFAYPTRFPVAVEDRILFLVIDRHGYRVGHLGFASCLNDSCAMEIDNVVRGVASGSPGIMAEAMRVIAAWAHTNFWPDEIFLRVLSDNPHAIAFYEGLGYVTAESLPLRRHQQGDVVAFKSLEPGDKAPPDTAFLRMVAHPNTSIIGTTTILTAGPSISARETVYANDATRYGWNNQWSKYLKSFEKAFADYVGVKYAMATSSCTGALHIALKALGIGPGDEVIIPDITWVATANAVLYVGATPVFADVERGSWCLDPRSFEALITPKTKAVIPVHLYGHPANMGEIVAIARRHGLRIVEDAAPSIGAEFNGRRTGSFGDFAAFSFQGAKLAVTGEGGILLTNDSQLYETAYSIWDQGRKPGTFWIQSNGLKYKMANVLAAIGLGQLERNDGMVEAKRRIFVWYSEELQGVPHVSLNREMPWARSIYWMTSLVLEEDARVTRDQLIQELKKRNIDTRPVFPAISQYPIWPRAQEPQPVAKWLGDRAINLPSGVCLTRAEIAYVARNIRDILSS